MSIIDIDDWSAKPRQDLYETCQIGYKIVNATQSRTRELKCDRSRTPCFEWNT